MSPLSKATPKPRKGENRPSEDTEEARGLWTHFVTCCRANDGSFRTVEASRSGAGDRLHALGFLWAAPTLSQSLRR